MGADDQGEWHELGDPRADMEWRAAKSANLQLRTARTAYRDALRREGHSPRAEWEATNAAADVLSSTLATSPHLDKGDRQEFRYELDRTRAVLAVGHLLTPARAAGISAAVGEIVDSIKAADSAAECDVESAVLLTMLARPSGADYWDLLRKVRGFLVSAVQDGTATQGQKILRLAVRELAPERAFGDYTAYTSSPRGGSRTDRVRSVFGGGLPGLGRRSS